MKNLSDLNPEKYRSFYSMNEVATILRHLTKTWKANGFSNFLGKFLLFSVEGSNFKGWVCIGVNALDLFDVFLVDKDQNVIHELTHIYIDELIDQLDAKIEKIPVFRF